MKKEEPQPKGFVRCLHFEELRTIRRKQPDKFLTMSASIKRQLELYCFMRNRDAKAKNAEKRERKLRGAACQCCGESIYQALTFDHITPKSKGGTAEPHNLQILCVLCNQLKADGQSCAHEMIARELIWQNVTIERKEGAA